MDDIYDLSDGVTLDRQPLPTDVPEGHIGLVIEVENTYEFHEDVTTYASVVVPIPPAEGTDAYEEWKFNQLIDRVIGVGYTDGDSWYDLMVLESSAPDIIPVDTTYDWGY